MKNHVVLMGFVLICFGLMGRLGFLPPQFQGAFSGFPSWFWLNLTMLGNVCVIYGLFARGRRRRWSTSHYPSSPIKHTWSSATPIKPKPKPASKALTALRCENCSAPLPEDQSCEYCGMRHG